MAGETTPSKLPWLDAIKQTGQLTIGFDASLGNAGWDRVFRNAIVEFNRLSTTHRLGVTFVQAQDPATANVEARAARGDFDFEYPPQIAKKKIPFDGAAVHGLCKPLLTTVRDRARVEQWKLMKAFIYVPAAPLTDKNTKARVVGDPVKLVIAVHEMIHACGVVDDKEHSVDDIFSWPQLRVGNQASEDRLATLGGTITFPGKPGEPPRTGHSTVDMPPLFLKPETATKVRNLWS
jgi:hypothetical protein